MSENNNQIKLGIVLSYLNIGIGNLIPLFYTPVMLSLLGQNEYGLYKIASSTTSYLSLVSFGIGSAVTRYLIKANVDGGKKEEERTFGLFNLIFQAISVITLVIGTAITFNLNLIYSSSLTVEQLSRMKILVGILVINTAVSFSASSYNAVVSTHEKFFFIQSINILSTIGAPVLNLVVLLCGYKSIGMAIASLALNVLTRIAYIVYVRRIIGLRPRYDNLPVDIIKEVLKFSFWIFVSNVIGQLYGSTDVIIIGSIPALATIGAAVYSIGATFPNIMFSMAQVMPSIFMPKANKMVFAGSTNKELTDLVIKVGRMQAFIVTLVCSGFAVFGKQFIYFYAGEEYSEAYWVAIIIMIPNCIPLVQSAAHSIIQAKNMHKFRSEVYLVIAIINVVGTLLLVRQFGIIGAAIPTGVAFFIGHGLIMNWYYWKKVHLDIPRFWKEIIPIFLMSIIMSICTLIISKWIDFYQIGVLMTGILIYTIIYCICLWMIILNDYEKKVLSDPMTKILKVFHH